ncbi:addiction module antidote protein [Pseudomonas aeruginosa]|uniref:addiction module antidote protein n=1 Tax=Pseudomonas aeruginosa TaxID=287 RepID=UPI001CD6597E|nr:addiction module antidote protein [Pseudomonas aeruginosa]
MKDRPHDTAMAEHFRAHPTYAAELLLADVRRDGNPAELAILLRQMATASVDVAGLDDAETGRATRADF